MMANKKKKINRRQQAHDSKNGKDIKVENTKLTVTKQTIKLSQ